MSYEGILTCVVNSCLNSSTVPLESCTEFLRTRIIYVQECLKISPHNYKNAVFKFIVKTHTLLAKLELHLENIKNAIKIV